MTQQEFKDWMKLPVVERQQIKQNNLLIALFMGGQIKDKEVGLLYVKTKDNKKPYHILLTRLKYHYSWEWLMAVVDKIEEKGHRFHISTTFIRVYHDKYEEYNCSVFDGKKTATYMAVVEFIKWYNIQNHIE